MTDKKEQINKVIESLNKVPQETKQMIYELSLSLSDTEIIQIFNQQSRDMFTLCINIAKKMKKEDKIKIGGYQSLFEHALKYNKKLPLEQFTLSILESAAEIYEENEEYFLGKNYTASIKLEVKNEYEFIRSQDFKDLWKILDNKDKTSIKEQLILITTYAHAYLYKTLINM